jgi:biopolymer transport protein TolR
MKFMGRAARMARHHKRHKSEAGINLVSMIDMLTVLVFFLLVYSTEEVEVLPNAKDVQLPESISDTRADQAVVVIVTETEIMMEGRSIGRIADILASKSVIIPALQAALESQAGKVLEDTTGQTEEEQILGREVTIMADKEIPYQLLKKVMATSTAADYGQLSLAVLQKGADRTAGAAVTVARVAQN